MRPRGVGRLRWRWWGSWPPAAAPRPRRSAAPHVAGAAGDAAHHGVRRGAQRPARGHGLPRRGLTRRRRAALRARPHLGRPRRAAHRQRDAGVPRGRRRPAHVQLDLARQLTVGHVWLDGKAVAVRAPGQGPRRRRAGHRRQPPRPPADLRRHPRAGGRAHRPRRLLDHRLDHRPRRHGLDDAGAVRRLQLVRRERPPVRQGVLRRHDPRAEGPGGGLERRAAVAHDPGRPHRHPVAPAGAGCVVPHHDRDRPLHRRRR